MLHTGTSDTWWWGATRSQNTSAPSPLLAWNLYGCCLLKQPAAFGETSPTHKCQSWMIRDFGKVSGMMQRFRWSEFGVIFFFILEGGCGRFRFRLVNKHAPCPQHSHWNKCMHVFTGFGPEDRGGWMKQQQGVAVPTVRDPIEHTPSQPRMFYGPPAAPHMHKTSPLVKKKEKKENKNERGGTNHSHTIPSPSTVQLLRLKKETQK